LLARSQHCGSEDQDGKKTVKNAVTIGSFTPDALLYGGRRRTARHCTAMQRNAYGNAFGVNASTCGAMRRFAATQRTASSAKGH